MVCDEDGHEWDSEEFCIWCGVDWLDAGDKSTSKF
jgi:hypothetical protein